MESKIKHLEMIQGIINRMASNSFYLKGWAVTLVAGIFAISAKDSEKTFFLISYIPILIFWGLDSYYLQLERKYRNLYKKVSQLKENEIDFSMTITEELCDEKTQYFNCLISITESLFYIPLAVLVIFIVNII